MGSSNGLIEKILSDIAEERFLMWANIFSFFVVFQWFLLEDPLFSLPVSITISIYLWLSLGGQLLRFVNMIVLDYNKTMSEYEESLKASGPSREYVSEDPFASIEKAWKKMVDLLGETTAGSEISVAKFREILRLEERDVILLLEHLDTHFPHMGTYNSLENIYLTSERISEISDPNLKNMVGYSTNTDNLNRTMKKRECCKLHGRLGDQYCNICGRIIPEEFIVKPETFD